MAGYVEVEEYYETGMWLSECLDSPITYPNRKSLEHVADLLIKASERIEYLLDRVPEDRL
jgi:predicted metalloprotease with PDZ domain